MLIVRRDKSQSGFYQLKKRLLLVIFSIILLRLGTLVPIPEISANHAFVLSKNKTLDTFDFLSGGSFGRMTVFSLGIMPYFSASIVVNILSNFSQKIKSLKREGSYGRNKLDHYTRLGAVSLAALQSILISGWIIRSGAISDCESSVVFTLIAVFGMVTGTTFLIWLGEQITEHGIGNGISMIVFIGIISKFPNIVHGIYLQFISGLVPKTRILFGILITVLTVFVIAVFERAQRRIKIHYAQRHQYSGRNSTTLHYIPLKISISGVIPSIFAISCVNFLFSVINFLSFFRWAYWLKPVSSFLQTGNCINILLTAVLIVVFNFIYTPLMLNTKEIADSLVKSNSFIPGLRTGEETVKYINEIVQRLTVFSSIYLVLITVLPEVLKILWKVPVYFNGSSVLISTVFIIDFFTKVQPFLIKGKRGKIEQKPRTKNSRIIGIT